MSEQSAFDAGQSAALRGCYRLLTCAESEQTRAEWYRGWDSVAPENRGKWPAAGPVPKDLQHLAGVEEIEEPAFNPNTNPNDSDGQPLEPGDYEVRRGGQVQLATVFEGEQCELLVRFAGSDRTQRVDECARHVSWQRITASGVR